jgi:hypothetical protein
MVEKSREISGKIEQETRFYITSPRPGPAQPSVDREQPALGQLFRDDKCRVRTDHAPANFTTIKLMAHNLLRKAPVKNSLRSRRKIAAWDYDFLASLITA